MFVKFGEMVSSCYTVSKQLNAQLTEVEYYIAHILKGIRYIKFILMLMIGFLQNLCKS